MKDIVDTIVQVWNDIWPLIPSRRERIATAVLAGLRNADWFYKSNMDMTVLWSVKYADALIAELDKDTPDANH